MGGTNGQEKALGMYEGAGEQDLDEDVTQKKPSFVNIPADIKKGMPEGAEVVSIVTTETHTTTTVTTTNKVTN